MPRGKPDPEARVKIWNFLMDNPGRTSVEVARAALGLKAPTTSLLPGTHGTLVRMETAGLVRRESAFRPQQGRTVSVWFAVPGKF
jgi:hypothetical protein